MQTNPIRPLIDKWYNRRRGGPWFYPASPYGLGDLVPGDMPTRFGPLMPIPEAAAILAAHGVAPFPAEYFPQSLGQDTGRVYDSRPIERHPFPANLNQRPDAGLPVNAQVLMRPMPSVFYPRPDASTIPVEGGLGCWVQEHPVLAAAGAAALYFVLKGGKR